MEIDAAKYWSLRPEVRFPECVIDRTITSQLKENGYKSGFVTGHFRIITDEDLTPNFIGRCSYSTLHFQQPPTDSLQCINKLTKQ